MEHGKKIQLWIIWNIYETNIVNYIKVKRLAWAGHLVHKNNDRTLKKIFNTKPVGIRSVGRPKLRWEDGVDQDVRILGVKNWKKVALDRDEWAQLLKKARAHQGLSSQWWWWISLNICHKEYNTGHHRYVFSFTICFVVTFFWRRRRKGENGNRSSSWNPVH